ncbi:hypothetical protein ACYSNV_06145 [Myroides sp. LJL119]
MKKIVLLGLCLIGLVGCENKQLHLTRGSFTDTEFVENHSPVYLEKDSQTNQLIENQDNRIAGTNYIFSVERSLNLLQVANSVSKIKNTKYDPENMHADQLQVYFSYADTLNKKLAFFNFKELDFGFNGPSALENLVYVKNKDTVLIEGYPAKMDQLIEIIKDKDSIQLGFNKDLDFETYLQTRLYLKQNNLQDKFVATDLIY